MTSFSNSQISEFLTNIATAYHIKKGDRFKIAAYENAADTIISYPESIYSLWQKDPKLLDSVPNIGQGIIKKLAYFFISRLHPDLKKLFSGIHPAVFTLTKINGVGPIIAHKLTQEFKFPKNSTLKILETTVRLCQKHQIQKLPTFGEKSEEMILTNTLAYLGQGQRLPFAKAQQISQELIDYLHLQFPQTEFIALGSLRRHSDTVGDIDIASKSDNPTPILQSFVDYPKNLHTLDLGPKKASIRLVDNIRADLMVQPPASWGSLLQHFTGNRQHNISLRKHALKLGFSLSEYGIKDLKTGYIHQFDNETDFYHFLHLNYISPENRLGKNEIENAKMS